MWEKVIKFLKKIFGIKTLPKQVTESDTLVARWWDIYSGSAAWLRMQFITSNGRKHDHTRRTLNPAQLVCAEIARLVLAEVPEAKVSPLVADVIKFECLWQNMRLYTEYQAALGGMVIRARPTDDRIVLDFVSALNFIPISSDNRRVTEATFIDRRVDGDKTYIRLETYKKVVGGYEISSRAFEETKPDVEVPLDALWPGVSPLVTLAMDVPPFVYFANPGANNIYPDSPLGISAFHNARDICQAADIGYDEFCWEVESGQRRIALPGVCMRTYHDTDTDKDRMGLDLNDRVFLRLEGDDAEKFKPTDLTFDIRTDQFISAINYHLNLLSVRCGFDAGYFSFDGKSVKTATEVISENSKTYKTREDFRAVTDAGLKELFDIINALGKIYEVAGFSDAPSELIWDDGIIEDRNSRAIYHEALFAQGLEDRITALRAIHGISEEAAVEMAAKIDAGKPETVIDPFGIGR